MRLGSVFRSKHHGQPKNFRCYQHIAIVWPTDDAPVLIAAYLTACAGPEAKRNSVLARVGQAVAQCVESK
jgi:hypothetical protein